MEIPNFIVAIASLVVAIVAGIYIPLHYRQRDSDKHNRDN